MIARGEVWRVRLPYTGTHTHAGERPAVIVQEDSAIASLPTVLIVPFTSNQGTTRYPGTLLIAPDGTNGLRQPSVALTFQIYPLDQRNCLSRLGILDARTLDQLLALLDKLTGR